MTFSKNTLALTYTGILFFGFFLSGLFDVLNYFIIKALLFLGFSVLGATLIWIGVKALNDKKNHLK
jgi:hypothetical protein